MLLCLVKVRLDSRWIRGACANSEIVNGRGRGDISRTVIVAGEISLYVPAL
jgi:hypothetical protein